jgi:hypothetical protein
LARGTEHEWISYAVTVASTILFAYTTVHPIALLAAGAAILLIVGG